MCFVFRNLDKTTQAKNIWCGYNDKLDWFLQLRHKPLHKHRHLNTQYKEKGYLEVIGDLDLYIF